MEKFEVFTGSGSPDRISAEIKLGAFEYTVAGKAES